ncbi:hypothetical protein AYK24_09135 [Thermoplasmatales archaeon SG8-52-4]|nr:MAG: hypothetical protein AYK24_09135 [Thermoplasmatales archaeon SG8-52-4]
MKNIFYKKLTIIGIFIIFLGAAIVPSISGYDNKTKIEQLIESPTGEPLDYDFVNAYWKFDGCTGNTVEDSSSHNYHGTLYGGTWISGGYEGCGLEFDGIDDYVDFTDHVKELAVNKTDDYIINFKFKSASTTNYGIILSYTGYKNIPEFKIELQPNGSILLRIWTGLCGIVLYSGEGHNDGEWHDVDIIFSGITTDPTVWIYVDNNLDGQLTHWLCDIENTDFLEAAIGRRASEETGYFEGVLDEFKFIKYDGGNEQLPPDISGPVDGDPGAELDFTFITDDPEGDEVYIKINWGDGEISDWLGPYDSGEEAIVSHSWDNEGAYFIKAKSMDFWDDSYWTSDVNAYEVKIGNQAPSKPIITGPGYGDPDQELTYSFRSDDYENQDLYYIVDWDDGTTTETGSYPANTPVQLTHSWDSEGDYFITAQAFDIYDKSSGASDPLWIRIGDQPPRKPDIDGPINAPAGEAINFMFSVLDPEDDQVSFNIKWGDGDEIEETELYDSEDIVTITHTWTKTGKYIVEARAKDIFGYWGNWQSFEIKIPRNKAINSYNLIELLFERFPNAFPILRYFLAY